MGIITEFIAGHLNCLTIIIILFTYPPPFSDQMDAKQTKRMSIDDGNCLTFGNRVYVLERCTCMSLG